MFLAALAIPPLNGGHIIWAVGIVAIMGANSGLGALVEGGYIEIRHPDWSRLHGIDHVVLVASMVILAVADAAFIWWVYSDTTSWIRWGVVLLSVAAVVAGGLSSWLRLWPHKRATETASQRIYPFSILSLLLGSGLGIGLSAVLLLGSAYIQNNQTPVSPAIPVIHDIAGRYVAIGDSYSAGEGLTPFTAGTRETDCDRSASQAYPEKLTFSSTGTTRTFTACSGAIIHDALNPTVRNGIVVPPQVAGGVQPGVGLVTLTMGGNNALFSKIVIACFEEAHCDQATFPPKGVGQVEDVPPGPLLSSWGPATLLKIGDEFATLFPALRTDFPNARIVVIGYPYLFPSGPARLSNLDCFSVLRRFSESVRNGIRTLQTEFDDLTYEHAVAAHIEFVSPTAIWTGHEPCGDRGQFTNSIKPYLSFSSPIDGGTFHPNGAGQATLAALVACYLNANPRPPDAYLHPGAPLLVVPTTRLVSPTALGLAASPGSQSPVSGCPAPP